VITTEKHHEVIIKGAPNTPEGHRTIHHRNENDTYPAFAPSGGEIAYARSGPHFPAELAISNLAGGAVRVVEKRLAPADIKFSPDGKTLIFTHGSTVYSIGVDGEGLKRLITNATAPDFSPDGSQIAYMGTKTGAVYLADADGSDRRRVAITGLCQPIGSCAGNVGAVVFSPDGKKLAYASADRKRNPALFEVAVGGGHPKEIDSGSADRPGQTTGLSWQP
jgi:Tol biopolymer transport system component